ncbi:T9SS-dependent choice-of-anchor J family protein [Cesiribacter sp. SM1]|uniref:T9SS-dependent choice-of-anchor J family protein n=1 Tax=Cesiribacter sp. SM1 TaxID=2861196 RepID=UPI001CD74132|nr:choice-of-anchor J domain-containing protein [Cesiribacter sp. SM1]
MKVLLGIGLLLFPLLLQAQEKCATVPYQKQLLEQEPVLFDDEAEFEKWIQHKKKLSDQRIQPAGLDAEARFVIPVVVHIIHRGEAVGTGTNIPDEQVLSQLKILNDDFRAKNTTAINQLPDEFKALAADTEIEFVLAKQDPEGLPTTGIIRVASTETNWTQARDINLKSLSHWPSHKYLNLYSAELSSPVIGWAQFPQSDRLSGLNFSDVADETDGVVIDYRYLGTGYRAISSSKGRTATHEIGHYFGLRHIWGDGNCSKDDFVTDTPLVDKDHQGCPSESVLSTCTGGLAMFQNYMDYTDDGCMSLFTHGQKERLHVVLQNSPRRKDLNSSPGKLEPTTVANDAGIRELQLTPIQYCNGSYKPSLQVRNYGNTQVTEVKIELKIGQEVVKTYTLKTDLAYLESIDMELDELQIPAAGQQQISATITQTNAGQDNKTTNNTALAEIVVPLKTSLPLLQQFESGLSPFTVVNPDFGFTWQLADAPDGSTSGNTAAHLNFYEYEAIGQQDILASPILDLSQEERAYLSFDVSHARYQNSSNDGLRVYVTTDCRTNLQTAELIFEASGEELATATATNTPFAPASEADWRTIDLDLSAYAGIENVQVLFAGTNDYGNNIYLDNLSITNVIAAPLNIALTGVIQPTPVFGNSSSPIRAEIKNQGIETITSYVLQLTLDGTPLREVLIKDIVLEPQQKTTVQLGVLPLLEQGTHLLELLVHSPNEQTDGAMSDNLLKRQFAINPSSSLLPVRESFSTATFTDFSWTSVSPQPDFTGWENIDVTGPYAPEESLNYAAIADYAGNPRLREKWLASPRLDISNTSAAGMQFWYYAGGNGNVSLQILASMDNGLTWPISLWEKDYSELNPEMQQAPEVPGEASSWRKDFISLQELVGQSDVRVAFVATGQNGAAVFVDEIEFFLSDQPTPAPLPERNSVSLYPNPARGEFNLFFNMENPQGEAVVVELFNTNGSFISRKNFPNTLNQIYTLQVPDLPAGIYYLRIRSASLNTSRKLVLTR